MEIRLLSDGNGWRESWDSFVASSPGGTIFYRELDQAGSMIPRVERFVRDLGGQIAPYYSVRWGKGTGMLARSSVLVSRVLL